MSDNRIIRVILIHAPTQMIVEKYIPATLESYYQEIDCQTIALARPPALSGEDGIYVDDEGIFNARPGQAVAWTLGQGCAQPWFGSGVIVGTDDNGDSVDAVTPLDAVRANIFFAMPHIRINGRTVYVEPGTTRMCGFDQNSGRFRRFAS